MHVEMHIGGLSRGVDRGSILWKVLICFDLDYIKEYNNMHSNICWQNVSQFWYRPHCSQVNLRLIVMSKRYTRYLLMYTLQVRGFDMTRDK